MKIKMAMSLAGDGFALSPGEETERFGEAEAKRLVEAGYAVPVAETPVETAEKKAPRRETRDRSSARDRRSARG